MKAVLESGDLTLQYLSSDHDGMYTCEQSNDEETRITNSILRIENSSGKIAEVKNSLSIKKNCYYGLSESMLGHVYTPAL